VTASTVIPFGPQHPVLPEPIHFKLELQDETVISAVPQIGYVHRGIEKAGELREFSSNVFLVERICGICSFTHALAYCQTIEELMKVEVPDRARYLRVVWAELSRIHSHLLILGCLADAFGYESLFMQCWKVRETVVDLMEKTAGARVIISSCTIGGVRRDIPAELGEEVIKTLKALKPDIDRVCGVFEKDRSARKRSVGVGVLSKEQAWLTGAVGPVLRGSGNADDARMHGYAAYGDLGFAPIVETAGDTQARSMVRVREIYQSIDLIVRAIEKAPEGEIQTKVRGNPQGEAFCRVEAPRGELLYYVKANGTKNLERLRVRTPTYTNIPPLMTMMPGLELADVPVIIVSIDPCISCTER
jgi:ech hydrogenase subunit E